ncbi:MULTISPECIES: potassium-transporting ATPase subunit F [Exiguobacterium]
MSELILTIGIGYFVYLTVALLKPEQF